MNVLQMKAQDAPSAKLAECYVTIGGTRYLMLMAKDFEANFSKSTATVNILGRTGAGHKATGWEGTFTMTIYKATEIFDKICEDYKNTGRDTYFDIQVTSEDPTTGLGRSTKLYKDCILDGDVLLSAFDTEGGFLEQSVSGFFDDFEAPEKYKNPVGME